MTRMASGGIMRASRTYFNPVLSQEPRTGVKDEFKKKIDEIKGRYTKLVEDIRKPEEKAAKMV